MKQQSKLPVILLLCVFLLLISGCTSPQGPGIITGTDLKTNESVANRFSEVKSENRTVIDSAVELSKKYTTLTAQAADLSAKNQEITKENEQLKIANIKLEDKLKKAEAELSAANSLLLDMVSELNDWKASVMGFRSEMRQAAAAQLQALLKVLESLGVDTSETRALEPIASSKDQQAKSGVSVYGSK